MHCPALRTSARARSRRRRRRRRERGRSTEPPTLLQAVHLVFWRAQDPELRHLLSGNRDEAKQDCFHGCVGKAVARRRRLGFMPRLTPTNRPSRAAHYIRLRPWLRSSANISSKSADESAHAQISLPTLWVGLDSRVILSQRGGIPRSIGKSQESLSQTILVGCNVSRETGRTDCADRPQHVRRHSFVKIYVLSVATRRVQSRQWPSTPNVWLTEPWGGHHSKWLIRSAPLTPHRGGPTQDGEKVRVIEQAWRYEYEPPSEPIRFSPAMITFSALLLLSARAQPAAAPRHPFT